MSGHCERSNVCAVDSFSLSMFAVSSWPWPEGRINVQGTAVNLPRCSAVFSERTANSILPVAGSTTKSLIWPRVSPDVDLTCWRESWLARINFCDWPLALDPLLPVAPWPEIEGGVEDD